MRIKPGHIVPLLLALALFASCRRAKLIPRKELTQIVYEMLLRDQQLKVDRRSAAVPDTVLVYEGIFEAHGYDTDDYLYSIEHYLRDPERFSRVFRDVNTKMEREKARVEREISKRDWRLKYTAKDFMPADSVLNMICPDSLYLGNLKFARDTVTGDFRFMPDE
ncbi:MAG: DUF4296 domain-containing protein [Bacteroidales bacterium]|nr:DUF4296 domain-containing protein [Bacteroidales bacterium]